jgi:hypothetical protein
MPVNVRYKGGPLNLKKATLKDTDTAPGTIKAAEQAKAKNMKPGIYMRAAVTDDGTYLYHWSYYA